MYTIFINKNFYKMITSFVVRSRIMTYYDNKNSYNSVFTYIEPLEYSIEANENLMKYIIKNNKNYQFNSVFTFSNINRLTFNSDYYNESNNFNYITNYYKCGDDLIVMGVSSHNSSVPNYDNVFKLISCLQKDYEIKLSYERKTTEYNRGDLGVSIIINITPIKELTVDDLINFIPNINLENNNKIPDYYPEVKNPKNKKMKYTIYE